LALRQGLRACSAFGLFGSGGEPDTLDSLAIGLVLTFEALSSHELEWPLGLFSLVVGIIWVVGRVGWWIVWKHSTKRY
jgi:hypothetical protein